MRAVPLRFIALPETSKSTSTTAPKLLPNLFARGGRQVPKYTFNIESASRLKSEISQRLNVSVKMVETHLTSLYGKLGVQSRAEAIALTQRQGLLLEG